VEEEVTRSVLRRRVTFSYDVCADMDPPPSSLTEDDVRLDPRPSQTAQEFMERLLHTRSVTIRLFDPMQLLGEAENVNGEVLASPYGLSSGGASPQAQLSFMSLASGGDLSLSLSPSPQDASGANDNTTDGTGLNAAANGPQQQQQQQQGGVGDRSSDSLLDDAGKRGSVFEGGGGGGGFGAFGGGQASADPKQRFLRHWTLQPMDIRQIRLLDLVAWVSYQTKIPSSRLQVTCSPLTAQEPFSAYLWRNGRGNRGESDGMKHTLADMYRHDPIVVQMSIMPIPRVLFERDFAVEEESHLRHRLICVRLFNDAVEVVGCIAIRIWMWLSMADLLKEVKRRVTPEMIARGFDPSRPLRVYQPKDTGTLTLPGSVMTKVAEHPLGTNMQEITDIDDGQPLSHVLNCIAKPGRDNPFYWHLRVEHADDPDTAERLVKEELKHVMVVHASPRENNRAFGHQFLITMERDERVGSLKQRIQRKVKLSDKEFAKWRFYKWDLIHKSFLRDDDTLDWNAKALMLLAEHDNPNSRTHQARRDRPLRIR